MNKDRAFTLIELLVVISIVGLLSSVVMASLNAARDKGRLGAGRQFDANVYHATADQAVGIWDFNECSGLSVADRSGYGNVGTLTGAPSWPTDSPQTNGCAVAMSSTVRMSVNNHSSLVTSIPLTISMWLRTPAYSGTTNPRLIEKYDDANNEYAVALGGVNAPGQLTFRVKKAGVVYESTTNSFFPTGRWVHVACVFDGTSFNIYFDGAPQKLGTYSFVVQTLDGKLYAGGTVATFIGDMDNLRIYNKALVASDVRDLYASERQQFLSRNNEN